MELCFFFELRHSPGAQIVFMAAPVQQADQNALTKKSQTAFRSILHSALLCVCASKCLCADVCSMYERYLGCKNLQYFAAFCRLSSFCCRIFWNWARHRYLHSFLLPPPQNTGIFRLLSRRENGAPPVPHTTIPTSFQSRPHTAATPPDSRWHKMSKAPKCQVKTQIKVFWYQICGQN